MDLTLGESARETYGLAVWTAQFTSLRQEIVQKLLIEHQLVALVPVGLGTFLTIGVPQQIGPWLVAIYPILTVLVALGWSHQEAGTLRIAAYLMEHHEVSRDGYPMWETYLARWREKHNRGSFITPFGMPSVAGVFVGAQVTAAVTCVVLLHSNTLVEWIVASLLLIGEGGIAMLTVGILRAGVRIDDVAAPVVLPSDCTIS